MRDGMSPIWQPAPGSDISLAEVQRRGKEFAAFIRESSNVWPNDTPEKQRKRKETALTDPLQWFRLYLPHYFEADPADVHRTWLALCEQGETAHQMVLLCTPRGHAKSTVITFADTLRPAMPSRPGQTPLPDRAVQIGDPRHSDHHGDPGRARQQPSPAT